MNNVVDFRDNYSDGYIVSEILRMVGMIEAIREIEEVLSKYGIITSISLKEEQSQANNPILRGFGNSRYIEERPTAHTIKYLDIEILLNKRS